MIFKIFLNICVGIFGLGIVVFIHEAGHYLAAKLFGIEVEAFSIGWGKKIISFKKGKTDYRISLFPVGGYCILKGEEDFKKSLENNETYLKKEEGSLYAAAPWKRIIVYFAGPFMNLLFSVIILSIIWFNGFSYYSPDNRIVLASEYNNEQNIFPANAAGLKTGDKIIKVDNVNISNYQEIREKVATNPEKQITITALRDNETITTKIVPDLNKKTGAGVIGIYPWVDTVISKIKSESPADIAGLKEGDILTEIDGNPINNQIDILKAFESKPNKVTLTYVRQNEQKTAVIIPNYSEAAQTDIGIAFHTDKYTTPSLSFAGAVKKGFSESFSTLFLSIKGLGLLFKGIDINNALSGPIRITYMVGEVATQALDESFSNAVTNFFQFLSLICVALFFMNLLPIPALDGGQIVFAFFEIIMRRDIKLKIIYRYQIAGTVFLVTILFFSLFNDIIFFIKN